MESSTWNQLIAKLHQPHLLQTSQWAEVKGRFGWKASCLTWEAADQGCSLGISHPSANFNSPVKAAGLLLERTVLPGLTVHYLPKGPLLEDPQDRDLWDQVLSDLEDFSRQRGALQLKIDPDLEIGRGDPREEDAREIALGIDLQEGLKARGWQFSREQIQFRNTVLVDLRDPEDDLLARMKSKTRYNIRLSGRKGISVRRGSKADLDTLYRMYAATSARGGFTIRGEEYYQALWRTFLDSSGTAGINPAAQPLIAEFEGKAVAGAVIFAFGDRAWYLHGMSLPDHSEKMPTYLIQWEAIRWAKERGCKVYDMWGAPDHFERSDSLWGVYRFKSGFGGEVSRTLGAWDFPARPVRYSLYNSWLPRILDLMRWFADRRSQRISAGEPG